MAYATVAEVVSDAAVLLGLTSTEIADPYASTDSNILLLLAILKTAGKDLLRQYTWKQLEAEHTFSTVASQDTYSLPADFARHLDQTQWNRSTTLPLVGPMASQGWQRLKSSGVPSGAEYYFRTAGSTLRLYPVPGSVQTIALEYVSTYWVQGSGSASRDKEWPTAANDTLWLDSQLLVHRLRMDFRQARGMESTAESLAYDEALSAARSAEPAPVLNLNRRSGPAAPSLPATGWGS